MNKKHKIRAIISFIIFIIIGYYILQLFANIVNNPTNTVFVKEGVISKEETNVGYVIRDETIVKGNNYKNGMIQIIDEGKKVSKNEPIFRYYSNDEDNIKEKISNLDQEIEKEMNNNNIEDIFSSDTKLIEKEIEEKIYLMNDLNNIQKIQENKKIIDNLITKKAEITGELSPKGSHLKELINQRSEYQRQLTEGAEYIYSTRSGILSYRTDGLEETLNTQDLSKYNKDFLSKLNLKTGQIVSTNTEQGKLVSNFECYIICTTKSEEAKKAEIGDKIKIMLPSTQIVDADIANIIKENDQENTLAIRFSNGIDEMINYRKVTFDIIWWNSEGYKVPKSTIVTENDLNYVIKTKKGFLEKILVKVVKETDDYAIIGNYSTSEIKELNIKSDVNKSILLNDEILLNPTENDIKNTE